MRPFWLLAGFVPLVAAQNASKGNEDQSLLWGTYRPNLYFGLRPRLPQSLMSGLMWWGTQDYASFGKMRHSCEQGDGLDGYTWMEHDMREGGVQVLKDSQNNVQLTVEWLKVPGGHHGGSWAARIKGETMEPSKPMRLSLLYYFGLEGLGSLDWESERNEDGVIGPVHLSGSTPDLGNFKIRIEDGPQTQYTTYGPHFETFKQRTGKSQFLGVPVPSGEIWGAKDLIYQHIGERAQEIVMSYKEDPRGPPDPAFVEGLANQIREGSNFYAVQKMLDGPFSIDIIYEAEDVHQHIDGTLINQGVLSFVDAFTQRFQETFPIPPGSPPSYLAFSKAITSNLFGGIGYFYGGSIVDRAFKHEWDQTDDDEEDETTTDQNPQPKLQPPRGLLTATPSRPFFPRGFYWDEGFHLLLIGEWDNGLSLEILKDWFSLIDENGWVGREQILGEEARSKVPPEFQAQYPSNANPPTLTMAVTAFIDRLERAAKGPTDDELGLGSAAGSQQIFKTSSESSSLSDVHLRDREAAVAYLKSIYPALRRHYDWFRHTQRGQIKQYGRKARSRTEAYRWRGRTMEHVLTSGMDDYPRGAPHAGELHLDLMAWMAFFSRTMRRIAEFVGEEDDIKTFIEIERAVLNNMEDLHWNEEEKVYCDVSVNDDDESVHVCHRGYLSLFPLLLGLLPSSSPHLGPILDLMRDPEHLWSPYGLRSLSASHPLFGQGENYWRGPIWVHMNYMALSSLYKIYAAEPGPYQQQAASIYTELRKNVIDNVYKEYERTGYVWEQYDALTGEGKRSHPFTGWTSLVTLILSEKY